MFFYQHANLLSYRYHIYDHKGERREILNQQCGNFVSPFWQRELLQKHCLCAYDAIHDSDMLLLTLSLQLLPFSGLANQSSLVGVEHIVTGEPMWEYRHRLHGMVKTQRCI